MQNLDLELRKQVAKACGWINIQDCSRTAFSRSQGVVFCLTGNLEAGLKIIPEYELSIDAIAAEFDKKGWGWGLESVHYQSSDSIEYLATSGFYELEIEAKTAAIALCKLFLQIHQQNHGCLPLYK
jgi:hypothetical protein